MCEYFQAAAFNCQVVPLVIPVRFECSLRSVSVYGAWGESIRAVREASCLSVSKPGVKLASWKTLRERGCQCAGLSKKWIKQAAHVWNWIVFYTPLQTELNLSSLPIIPLVNSPFHLIPVVLHVTSSYTESLSCMERGLCEIELNSGVIFILFLFFHMRTACDIQRVSLVSCKAAVCDSATPASSLLPRLSSLNKIRPSPPFPFTAQHSF